MISRFCPTNTTINLKITLSVFPLLARNFTKLVITPITKTNTNGFIDWLNMTSYIPALVKVEMWGVMRIDYQNPEDDPMYDNYYIVTAGGGAPLYDIDAIQPETVKAVKIEHYMHIAVNEKEAVMKVIDINGNLIEEIKVPRRH